MSMDKYLTKQREKEAILNDSIIGLRILLDHAPSLCYCDECKAIRKRLGMNENADLDVFKLPEKV